MVKVNGLYNLNTEAAVGNYFVLAFLFNVPCFLCQLMSFVIQYFTNNLLNAIFAALSNGWCRYWTNQCQCISDLNKYPSSFTQYSDYTPEISWNCYWGSCSECWGLILCGGLVMTVKNRQKLKPDLAAASG